MYWPTTFTDKDIDIQNYMSIICPLYKTNRSHLLFSPEPMCPSLPMNGSYPRTHFVLHTSLTLPTYEPSLTWTQHIKQNIHPNQKRPKFRILSLNPPPLTTQSYDRPFQFRANTTKVSPNNPGIEKEERMACFPPSQLYTWQKRHLVRFSRKKKSKKQGGPPGWAEVGCVCVVCCV